MHHLDHHVLIKLVVVLSTAVVIVYFSAIGYLDFSPATNQTDAALSPTEAGQSLVDTGEYEEAIALYRDQIATLETELESANLNLADAYADNQELADAEAAYNKVLRLNSQLQPAYVGLAQVLVDQGKYVEAAGVIASGLTAFPADRELVDLDTVVTEAQAQ